MMFRSALTLSLALGFATPAFANTVNVTGAALLPIESFFTRSEFAGAALSPNGRFLAVKVGQEPARMRLAVINLDDKSIKVIASFSGRDVGDFHWINDNRLVYTSGNAQMSLGEANVAEDSGPGLFAVNRDGSDPRQLISTMRNFFSSGTARQLRADHSLVPAFGPRNSEYVHVVRAVRRGDQPGSELDRYDLYKLNTLTGHVTSVDRPTGSQGFVFDHKGEPRLAQTRAGLAVTYHYREPATGAWRPLVTFDSTLKATENTWTPVAFAPDGTLYATGRRNEDKTALYRINLATGQMEGAPVLALEDFDFRGSLVVGEKELLGIAYVSDAPGTAWMDAGMKKLQDEIDAVLKTTVNTITKPLRAETPHVMVTSMSDVQPPVYWLYDTAKKSFSKLGEAQEFIKVKARDGMTIPAWLTIPNGSNRKALPMFVMVHGGPWVAGTDWGWNPAGQFLASRGYAVLEPEFRGTLGYGEKHFRSSFKQWGLAMQNDVADTVRWAIKEGIADPKRICIGGASYGGYATLMGLVNDPDLFKCGINWVGVTDINLMYTGHWSAQSDGTDTQKKLGMPVMIGDPVKDAEQLKKTSPIEQAAKITQPLLMAYGAQDLRVPIYHGRKFEEAVRKTNPNVEMIVYEEEGHGWGMRKNQLDWWNRVEKFLNQHIGK
jgi:dipeptidyl aminopeptidase/acylaminoacyl peptidase